MHIALYTDTFMPQVNGVVGVVKNLAEEFSAQGHTVTVCAPTGPDKLVTMPKRLKREFGKYRLISYASTQLPSYKEQRVTLPSVLGSVWWVRQSRPDVIHAHTPFGMGWEGAAISKMFGIPMLGTLHTFHMEYAKHIGLDNKAIEPLLNKYEPTFYNRCLLVTSPSQALADELKAHGVYRPMVRVVNPVDIEKFGVEPTSKLQLKHELGLGAPTLLYLGRLSYEKNLTELVEIVEPVLRENPEASLALVGDGPSREDLEKQVAKLGLINQVKFFGIKKGEALKKIIAASDMFVTTSLTENQPLSIIEAMAAGLPVVAYAARGIPEIVAANSTGKLVKTGDQEGYRDALRELIKFEAVRDTLGRRAKQSVKQFSRPAVSAELLSLYHDMTSAKYI